MVAHLTADQRVAGSSPVLKSFFRDSSMAEHPCPSHGDGCWFDSSSRYFLSLSRDSSIW